MTQSPPPSNQPIHFFRNYNRVVGAAYGAIVVSLCLVFWYQLSQKVTEEVSLIKGHVERHAQFFEFVLSSSVDHLETLRMGAGNDDVRPVGAASGTRVTSDSPMVAMLKPASDGATFSMDGAPDRDIGGNVVGSGALKGRDASFYHDLDMALAMLPGLRSLAFNLPSAARARYTSGNGFALTGPWISSKDQPFDAKTYESVAWRLSQPAANPDRTKFWAPIYFGGKEHGLVVPAVAPVYQGPRFAGMLAVDTSLDYLNRINADFGYGLGTVFLIDANTQVLAHAGLYADPLALERAPGLDAALPKAIVDSGVDITGLAPGTAHAVAGHTVIVQRFVSAPWQLVYVVPRQALWAKLVAERGGLMAAVLVGLMLMMLVTYLVTSREFVGPAAKLVQHLATESRFVPAQIPVVPSSWRPWFETVSKAFRESMQLIGLRQELDIAANMQRAILPRHWPKDPDYTVWGVMRSAREVGGDFYDHFKVADQRLGLVVADVSGKGIPAALFGMVSKTLVRAIAMRTTLSFGDAIREVNEGLCEDNESCMFVTTLYAVFDAHTGVVDYVNAGHPPPLLISPNGQARFIAGTDGLALGVMEGVAFKQAQVRLQPGDVLLMYTDGVTEAMNVGSEEFGADRLKALFTQSGAGMTPRSVIDAVIAAVDAFAGGADQSDDITCVALHYHPQAVPGVPAQRTTPKEVA